MNEKLKKSNFFENLALKDDGSVIFIATAIEPKHYQNEPPSILQLMSLGKDQLSNIAIEAMEALEEYGNLSGSCDWMLFKWRIWSFLEIQDIFDAPIYDNRDFSEIFQLWYFYYESKYILIESLLAGFNGLYQSSHLSLRLFLEFSVLQNYYYLDSFKRESYLNIDKFHKTRIKPKWSTLTKGALQKNSFTIPIIERIKAHYDALSEHSSHAYHNDFSPKVTNRVSTPTHSMLGVLTFWRIIDLILESVLWMYYANFPMLLQPKQTIRKFGYNAPLGTFLDLSQAHIIRNALTKVDLELFQKYSDQDENVRVLNEWFESQSDLSNDEIVKSWNKEINGNFPEDVERAKLKNLAKLRSSREMMALHSIDSKLDEINPSELDLTLTSWKNYLARKKGRGKCDSSS